jgi:hypothetical protein
VRAGEGRSYAGHIEEWSSRLESCSAAKRCQSYTTIIKSDVVAQKETQGD